MRMTQTDTVQRIMDTAERLFAQEGYSQTSLRTITRLAEVNLAAVNYHFGSKDTLLQAVCSRFLTPLLARLEQTLAPIESGVEEADVRQLISVLLSGLVAGRAPGDLGRDSFIRLLAWAFTQKEDHLIPYLYEVCGDILPRYLQAVSSAVPDLPLSELRWRLHFLMGAIFFTVSHFDRVRTFFEREARQETVTLDGVLEELVPGLAADLLLSPSRCG